MLLIAKLMITTVGVKQYGSMLYFVAVSVYYNIEISHWILVKRHFVWEYGF